MNIQNEVKALIKSHKGLRAAARATGVNPSTLSRIMNGQAVNLKLDTLRKLGLV